jgi:hypothetical protein
MMRERWMQLRAWRPGRLVGLTALAVVWGVLLLGVAVPSLQDVRRQHAEIAALERQLADLDRWTVAGLWLEPVVAAREPEVNAAWARVFPPGRDREQLFLDVAGVADRCGVQEFQLEEVSDLGSFDLGTWSTTDEPGPGDDEAGMTGDQPAPELTFQPYILRASFAADYARTAAFLGGLERIDRSLDVRRLAIRPARHGVTVELELEVPVSEPVTS